MYWSTEVEFHPAIFYNYIALLISGCFALFFWRVWWVCNHSHCPHAKKKKNWSEEGFSQELPHSSLFPSNLLVTRGNITKIEIRSVNQSHTGTTSLNSFFRRLYCDYIFVISSSLQQSLLLSLTLQVCLKYECLVSLKQQLTLCAA